MKNDNDADGCVSGCAAILIAGTALLVTAGAVSVALGLFIKIIKWVVSL